MPAMAFAFGLACSNHQTVLFAGLPLALFALWRDGALLPGRNPLKLEVYA